MANKNFSIQYIIKARNQFSAQARSAKEKIKGLRHEIFKLNKAGSDKVLEKSFNKIKVAAAAAFGAVAIGIRNVTKSGKEFETAMADLSAITGATGKDLDMMKSDIMDMSKTYVVSQSDVAESIKLVASAKPELLENRKELAETTKQALLLSNASGISLAEASTITAQSLNQMGRDASFASKFVDILAAGSKFGSSEIAETGEAVTIAGPAAKAAGLNFLQLNAAIQTVAKGGIKGSESGTALNSIFMRLRKQGANFKRDGLQFTFEKIKKSLESIKDPAKRAIAESKLFGDEHAKVGLALLENSSTLGQFEKNLDKSGVAMEQAAIRLDTLEKAGQATDFLINEKKIKVFEKMEPALKMVSAAFYDLIAGIDESDIEAIADVFSGLVVILGAALKVLKMLISVVKTALKPIIAILKGVGTVIGQIGGAIATLDFSNFDLSSAFDLGGKFLGVFGDGKQPVKKTSAVDKQSSTNVNLNVGLDKGLKQVTPVASANKGAVRTDVGRLAGAPL